MGVPYCIIKGKAMQWALVHRKIRIMVAFPHINLENKDVLVSWRKLLGSVIIADVMRNNVLNPKSMVHTAKLKKAKVKELTTKMS